jgi:hypothetical protein
MVTFLLESENKTAESFERRSMRDLTERRVMIAAVKAGFWLRGRHPATNDASRAAVARSRGCHGVFVVVPAGFAWQGLFAIAKYGTVLVMRKRATLDDQPQGGPRFARQVDFANGLRNQSARLRHTRARHRTRQCDNQPCATQDVPPQWPTGEKHG